MTVATEPAALAARLCEECGESFVPKQARSRYCKRDCRHRATARRWHRELSQRNKGRQPEGEKRCGKCGEVKDANEFGRDPYKADGLNFSCKQCCTDIKRKMKAKVMAHYGTSCACCGTSEQLTIDHVNGSGREHRKELFGHGGGAEMYRWLIKQGFPPGFQTLCNPCNSSKNRGERCRIDHQAPRKQRHRCSESADTRLIAAFLARQISASTPPAAVLSLISSLHGRGDRVTSVNDRRDLSDDNFVRTCA